MGSEVLLVEDNPGDVRLARDALRAVDSSINLSVASDGLEAMAFLLREDAHADAPRPNLILLDLHLPRMSGKEVLAKIKQNEGLRAIPTIILSSSALDADVHTAHILQANCYLTKPMQFDELDRIVGLINEFWLKVPELSTASPRAG